MSAGIAAHRRAYLSWGGIVAICCEMAIIPSRVYAANWKFEPRVEVIQSYLRSKDFSNANGWKTSNESATQVNPGVFFDGQSRRVSANVEYLMRNQYVLNDTADSYARYDQFFGRAHAVLLKDLFFVDAVGSLTQVFVAGSQGITRSELITTQNRTDAAVASISPVVQWHFGNAIQSQLRYSRDRVRYKGGDFGDSDGQIVNLTLSNDDNAARIRWLISGSRTDVDYLSGNTFSYRDYESKLSYRLSQTYGLIGLGGYEEYEYMGTQNSTNPVKKKWNVGAYWNPLRRAYLELLVGQRYYGNSYSGTFNLTGRRTEWSAAYTEDIFSTRQEQLELTAQRGNSNSISETAAFSLPALTEDIYVRKRLQLIVTRNQLKGYTRARLFYDRRDFQTRPEFDHSAGGEVVLEHKPTPRTFARLTLYGIRNRFQSASGNDYWDAEILYGFKPERIYEFSFVVRQEQSEPTSRNGRARNTFVSLAMQAHW